MPLPFGVCYKPLLPVLLLLLRCPISAQNQCQNWFNSSFARNRQSCVQGTPRYSYLLLLSSARSAPSLNFGFVFLFVVDVAKFALLKILISLCIVCWWSHAWPTCSTYSIVQSIDEECGLDLYVIRTEHEMQIKQWELVKSSGIWQSK